LWGNRLVWEFEKLEELQGQLAQLRTDFIVERNLREQAAGELSDLQDEYEVARQRNRDLMKENEMLKQELCAHGRAGHDIK
jgi:chromosome segregation ATPase